MAVINELTPHLALPLPHPDNSLEDDVLRLRDAFSALDAKIAALDTLLASDDVNLDVLQELVTAIKGDASNLLTHIGSGGASHAAATDSVAGFMSAADKTKLDGVTLGILFDSVDASVAADGDTVMTVTGGYTVGAIMVFMNGSKLKPADYTATNGTSITLASGALAADEFEVVRFKRALSV